MLQARRLTVAVLKSFQIIHTFDGAITFLSEDNNQITIWSESERDDALWWGKSACRLLTFDLACSKTPPVLGKLEELFLFITAIFLAE